MPKTTSESIKPSAVNGQPVQAEEPVTPTEVAPEAQPAEQGKVTVNLAVPFTNIRSETEGGTVTYGPGNVTVPSDVADDLIRRNVAYLEGENNRLSGIDRTSGHIGNLG